MNKKTNLRIEDLSTEQKIGMLLCARNFDSDNTEENLDFTLKLIKEHALGSVQVPIGNKVVMDKILEAADYPIIIVNDMEKGFPSPEIPQAPAISLAACNNPEHLRAFAKVTVSSAINAGYNCTWGPVIDVLYGDGPCRVYREFSDIPEKVALAAEEICKVYKSHGFLSTGKHYPGAHNLPFDTHMTEGFSELTKKEILEFDFIPYLHLHKKGLLPCIMTGHQYIPDIDSEYPASLSKKAIDIIRNLGFDGVCFTDSFAMMGILQKYGEENILGMAIAAGNDIVLPNYRRTNKECYDMMMKNYKDGAFTEERLNDAVRHVLEAQSFINTEPEVSGNYTEEDFNILKSVAKDCITSITDDGVSTCLPKDGKKRMFVISTDISATINKNSAEINNGIWYNPEAIASYIKEHCPDAIIDFLPELPGQLDNYRIFTKSAELDDVVFISFCTSTSYLGTDCLTRRTEAVINALAHSGKMSTLIHFGNPYALETLDHIPRKILGYIIPESQKYAIDALFGDFEPTGSVPFKINLK